MTIEIQWGYIILNGFFTGIGTGLGVLIANRLHDKLLKRKIERLEKLIKASKRDNGVGRK